MTTPFLDHFAEEERRRRQALIAEVFAEEGIQGLKNRGLLAPSFDRGPLRPFEGGERGVSPAQQPGPGERRGDVPILPEVADFSETLDFLGLLSKERKLPSVTLPEGTQRIIRSVTGGPFAGLPGAPRGFAPSTLGVRGALETAGPVDVPFLGLSGAVKTGARAGVRAAAPGVKAAWPAAGRLAREEAGFARIPGRKATDEAARAAEVARGQAEMPVTPSAAAAPRPAVAAKEPWEMTREEFAAGKSVMQRRNDALTPISNPRSHYAQIVKAINEGKPVPPEVRAEWMDLPTPSAAAPASGLPIPGIRRATKASRADQFREGLNAKSVFEGGEIDPRLTTHAWRSMGQVEFIRTISGKPFGGRPSARGGYWSWFPQRAALQKGSAKSSKYLVEVLGQTEGEGLVHPLTTRDITGVWKDEGKGWVKQPLPTTPGGPLVAQAEAEARAKVEAARATFQAKAAAKPTAPAQPVTPPARTADQAVPTAGQVPPPPAPAAPSQLRELHDKLFNSSVRQRGFIVSPDAAVSRYMKDLVRFANLIGDAQTIMRAEAAEGFWRSGAMQEALSASEESLGLGHTFIEKVAPSLRHTAFEGEIGRLAHEVISEARFARELPELQAAVRQTPPAPAAPSPAVAGAPPVQPPKPPVATVRTPAQATARVKEIQQQGQKAPEGVPPQEAKKAHIEMGAPDGPRPPVPPRPAARGAPPPPDDPADIVRQIAEKATQKERPDQTLLRLHEAAISTEARRNGIIVKEGNAKLKALGIGVTRRGQLVPRTQDIPQLDALSNALHNPSKVASGEIALPEGYEAIYAELRRRTDWTTASMLDFDPEAATIADYFYRGWKPPEGAFAGVSPGRSLVRTPAFKKPRVDATYQEMRNAGFEPLFWNPYQQWAIRQTMGTRYREQMELVAHLKGLGDDFARPHVGGPIPEGWRVPEVGPAFEGKPFATLDASGEPTTMFTRRWITPDRVANTLENIYGKRPDLGKLTVGTKTIDPLSIIDFLTFMPKRAKLLISAFQQVDFLTRAGAGSWTRMVDALSAGQPIQAVTALAKYPVTAATIIRSNFSPGLRLSLAKQLDSVKPLVEGRPGIHLKGISEAGLSTFDPAMFRWETMDKVVREVAQETGILGKGRRMVSLVGGIESAMRRGLFEGVYPAAMITDITNNVAPMLARMYPKLNDAQLNGTIARIINKKYSSIPASQSVLQNRVVRETLRRVFFSIGESEGLLRQAASTVAGPNKKFWVKHWLGTYLFVITTAAAIHYASTGKPLPKERYSPISKDKWGPLPFGYNTRFASPTIPIKGRGGAELTLDVVGQMDTALRILNPGQFISSRESVPIRASINQVSGADFFGNPIDDVGPGGVVSRTAQLAQDLFSPIGAGGISAELARRNIPGAERVINEGETRLGLPGMAVQATGVNLRAATREQRLRSTLGQKATTTLKAMDKFGVELGYVTARFDTQLGKKGGEITLTSEQREQLQWLTDDVVVEGLAKRFEERRFQALSDEEKKEDAKKLMTDLRANARAEYRKQLLRAAPTLPRLPQRPQTKPSLIPAGSLKGMNFADYQRQRAGAR